MRERRVGIVLAALVSAEPLAFDGLAEAIDAADAVFRPALDALVKMWTGEGERAAASARAALAAVDDADAEGLAFARAIGLLAAAQWPAADRELTDALAEAIAAPPAHETPVASAAAALLVEAVLACGRVDLAGDLLARSPMPNVLCGDDRHPFLSFLHCTHARVLLFGGDVAAAEPVVERAEASARTPVMVAFAQSCRAMLSAASDMRALAREAVREIEAARVVPSHLLAGGVHLMAAYAAITQNEVDTAARLILAATSRPDLSDMRIVDRALGVEILVRASVDAGESDVGRAWGDRVADLAAHPIADSTVARIESRLLLAEGDAIGALAAAERAIALAAARARGIEAAEGEILAARARVALGGAGDAARRLADVADRADDRGHRALRLAAARELRGTGRRLRPSTTSGWEGLSAREREVALLLAAGEGNTAIGARLHLSTHTVRMHVSRALHAFGAPTRAALAAQIAAQHPLSGRSLADLTPRQREVAARIADGASNAVIAADLGIGVFTVDKHVTAILRRWQLTSRAAIAAAVRAGAVSTP